MSSLISLSRTPARIIFSASTALKSWSAFCCAPSSAAPRVSVVTFTLESFPVLFFWSSSAAATAEEVYRGAKFKQGIARRVNAVHARNGVEDDSLLLVVVVRDAPIESDDTGFDLCAVFRPMDRGVVHDIAVG